MAKKNQPLAEQVAIAAIGKAFPYRTSKNAEDAIRDGESRTVKATIEIDGTVSRGEAGESAASASPLQDALLAVLAKGLDKRTMATKRRAAMSIVGKAAAAGITVAKYLSQHDPEHGALIADMKAEAARELPAVAKRGSLKFSGDARVVSVKVSAA